MSVSFASLDAACVTAFASLTVTHDPQTGTNQEGIAAIPNSPSQLSDGTPSGFVVISALKSAFSQTPIENDRIIIGATSYRIMSIADETDSGGGMIHMTLTQ